MTGQQFIGGLDLAISVGGIWVAVWQWLWRGRGRMYDHVFEGWKARVGGIVGLAGCAWFGWIALQMVGWP